MDFAGGLAAELRHDGAGAADEAADDGRVAHEAERDLPREDLEHGALVVRTVSRRRRRRGLALRRGRRGRRRLVIGGVGGGGVLHCVACGFQRGIFFSCHAPRVELSGVAHLDRREGTTKGESEGYKVRVKVKGFFMVWFGLVVFLLLIPERKRGWSDEMEHIERKQRGSVFEDSWTFLFLFLLFSI